MKTKHAPNFDIINRSDDNSFEAFHDEIKSHFDTFEMDPDLYCGPNRNNQRFGEIPLNAKSKHLAPKTVKFKKHKHKLSQWMTYGILNSIKYRDKMILKLKALSAGTDLHDRLSANLNSYNKTLKILTRQAKIQYFADQLNKNK